MFKFRNFLPVAFAVVSISCSSDDDNGGSESGLDRGLVIENCADIALTNYTDALNDAQSLKTSIDAFVAAPSASGLDNVKAAWLASRESYGTSEAFRFANGPIDSGETEEIEGLLNSWPLDEAYIDYVDGDADAGIINNTVDFPTLNKELLASQNGEGAEENVSVGYHAIEFLLWGQDLDDPSAKTAGQRPYTDFVDGGTAQNQDRRREYLSICADLLVEHLQVIVDAWGGSYQQTFFGLSQKQALSNMLASIAELSSSELAIERMAVALQNQDQEDEHSCFSDNTHRDIRLNWQGIKNVYTGSYASVSGASLADLVEEADADLAAELNTLLLDADTKINATLIPFDLAISGGESSAEGAKVLAAVQALVAFGDKLLEAKTTLDI